MRLKSTLMFVLATSVPATAIFAATAKKQQPKEALYDEEASDPLLDSLGQVGTNNEMAEDVDADEDNTSFDLESYESEPANNDRKITKSAERSEDVSRILELGLFPSFLIKDYPISGGFSLASEVQMHDDLWIYVSGEMSSYDDLSVNPVLDGVPEAGEALSLPSLDHMAFSAGGRYYLKSSVLKNNGLKNTSPQQFYVGASLAAGSWEGTYQTDEGQKFVSSIRELVVSGEAGYRWVTAQQFSLRLGLGLGLALPLQNKVKTSGQAYEESLAEDVRSLDFYQLRPAMQIGIGHSF